MRYPLFVILAACGTQSIITTHAPPADLLASAQTNTETHEFSMLTYNIAGLPAIFSQSSPERDTSLISPLLNPFDIVLVQEDFWYHADLISHDTHSYRSPPYREHRNIADIGDGLNQLANYPVTAFTRAAFDECNGTFSCDNDCLASKGFTFSKVELAPGVIVHLYNLHLDAGDCSADKKVRRAQVAELVTAIQSQSAKAAIILGGDTNLSPDSSEDQDTLAGLMKETGLHEICRTLTLACGASSIDRIMFRSSATVTLEPLSLDTPPGFVDGNGKDLSDHLPVRAHLRWTAPLVR